MSPETFRIFDPKADGNCFYYAASFLLHGGDISYHKRIREDIIKYLTQNEDYYSKFVDTKKLSYKKQLELFGRDYTSAEHILIDAFAQISEHYVWIYQPIVENSKFQGFQLNSNIPCRTKTNAPPINFLYFQVAEHYNALISAEKYRDYPVSKISNEEIIMKWWSNNKKRDDEDLKDLIQSAKKPDLNSSDPNLKNLDNGKKNDNLESESLDEQIIQQFSNQKDTFGPYPRYDSQADLYNEIYTML